MFGWGLLLDMMLYNLGKSEVMMDNQVNTTARDAVHQFSHYAKLVDQGREVIITRRGKPSLKLVLATPAPKMTKVERDALVQKALSFRAIKPYGKKFERADAYDE
jgi:antitoxin (DNA-binding transcriptional repressor) of toxin-antitoxin stability system